MLYLVPEAGLLISRASNLTKDPAKKPNTSNLTRSMLSQVDILRYDRRTSLWTSAILEYARPSSGLLARIERPHARHSEATHRNHNGNSQSLPSSPNAKICHPYEYVQKIFRGRCSSSALIRAQPCRSTAHEGPDASVNTRWQYLQIPRITPLQKPILQNTKL